MHRCLKIPEIQALVCKLLRVDGSSRALARLARTCRELSEPALDGLYYELIGLCSLIKCLPRDAWLVSPPVGWNTTIILQRALTKSDVDIICKYNKRVRVYHPNHPIPEFTTKLHSNVIQALLSAFPHLLFPNLKHLSFADDPATKDRTAQVLSLLLAPNLVSIKLNLESLDFATETLLNTLPSRVSPSTVRYLTFQKRSDGSQSHTSVSFPNLEKWQNLRSLTFSIVNFSDILHASNLPHLRKLSVGRIADPFGDGREHLPVIFPEMRHMDVEASAALAHQLLSAIQAPKLEHLSVIRKHRRPNEKILKDPGPLKGCLESIGRLCEASSPRLIHIELPCSIPEDSSIEAVLSPLFHYSMIRTLKLCVRAVPRISISDAEAITTAWPYLSTLYIIGHAEYSLGTDLSTLIPLAEGGTKLRRLSLKLDAYTSQDRQSLFETMYGRTPLHVSNTSLTTLIVNQSWITHKEFVAAFLSDLFPNLKFVIASGHNNPDYSNDHRRWGIIQTVLLPMLRMTKWRREQRQHFDSVGDTAIDDCRSHLNTVWNMDYDDADMSDAEMPYGAEDGESTSEEETDYGG